MDAQNFDFLADVTEQTTTRFVTFITPSMNRYDLAVTATERFFGKKLVTDLQRGITAVIGPDDIREEGVLESLFGWGEEETGELREFLAQLAGEAKPDDR